MRVDRSNQMPAETFRRRQLPHWDVPGATYFVTTCLAGSLPAMGLADLHKYRTELSKRTRPDEIEPDEWDIRIQKLIFSRTDNWLDSEPAVRHLSDQDLAQVVQDALLYHADDRCD